MPLNKPPLPLAADPQSVKRARDWVTGVLESLGRSDLVPAAELGVSELVTNAILHGVPPFDVRVRGTRDHPRVEVHDRSPRPPEVNLDMTEDENLLSTVGRGLALVAMYAKTWGAEVSGPGKSVWFEPGAQVRSGDLSGEVFDFTEAASRHEADIPDETVTIRFLGLPVALFGQFLQRYSELRRELGLLALTHGGDYPVARLLTEVSLRAEHERRLSSGAAEVDRALAEGRDRVDLEYRCPASCPATMGRLLEALEQADEFCREQRLLVLAANPQQVALQRWYLGEFVRQGAGEEPAPWPGGYEPEEHDTPVGARPEQGPGAWYDGRSRGSSHGARDAARPGASAHPGVAEPRLAVADLTDISPGATGQA